MFSTREGIKFPVALFVHGHKSHLMYQLSLLGSQLQTEVTAFYPNATKILQPVDMAAFCPIKIFWQRAVKKWRREVLNEVQIALFLKEVTESSTKPESLAKGFKACGLYPLNPNALDYSKCLQTSASATGPSENSRNTEN
jgi:hypothetical protein